MEKYITIPIPHSKKKIYAVRRGNFKKPVAVLVHGLSCTMNEHCLFNGSHFLETHGFSTLRFNLYDWHDDARKLHECDFTTYARDVETVVSYLRGKGVKKIFGVGHSFGGVSILYAKPNLFDAISLWDASNYATLPKGFEKKFTRIFHGKHLLRGNWDFVMNPKLLTQIETTDWKSLTSQFPTPTQVIVAGKGMLIKGGRQYFKNSSAVQKEFFVVKGAGHCFDEEGAEDQLFLATVKWFKKFV
ncbi:hypothetical protein CO174_01710 [Candidatus Uhrbacteria bacterium CG_4_9_14_3_um_filter_50_9]|uniref:AB hydrolase-1 domain-containing protein n=1 Tax=Candidatus Uhrbacteria bacterium CG_4_9_14_3_um_filter_50_9 TaxID=1975035 RepID=A0A2M7XCW0_9BACT|nr:MAG: hypothetical protein CO174_01710 [Candidatus Uhrbacteria bacterium CG_4_9_14_3_um_filter_50_9]